MFRPILFQSLYNFNSTQPSEPLNSSVKSNLNRKNRRTRLPPKRIKSNKDFCTTTCTTTNKIIIQTSNIQLNQPHAPLTNQYNKSTQPTIQRDIRDNIYNIPTNSYAELYNKSTTNYFGPDISNEKTSVTWNQGSLTNQQNFNYNE